MARAEGLRLEEIGVLTRLGRPNKPSSMGERLGSIIPLEELPTGTPILDMGALSQIKVVRKFPGAGRAAHGVLPFGWCIPLLVHDRPIIRHPSSKRSQNFSPLAVDFLLCSPYTLYRSFWSTFTLEGLYRHRPRSSHMDRGFVVSPYDLPAPNFTCVTFSSSIYPLRIRRRYTLSQTHRFNA